MNIAHIEIENMLGLSEVEIEPGKVTLLEGGNGAGKSAVLDSIIAAFSAKGIPGQIVTTGAEKGRVYIRLDDGHAIKAAFSPDGKKTVTVTTPEGDKKGSPQTWLDGLFSAQIVNPVQFIAMTTAQKREAMLAALPIAVSPDDICEWFGESLPVDTNKHGLMVLAEAEKLLYERRKTANATVGNLKGERDVIAKDIPSGFDASEWEQVDTGTLTGQLQDIGRIAEEKRQALLEAERVAQQAKTWKADAATQRAKQAALEAEIARLSSEREKVSASITELEDGAVAEEARAQEIAAQAEAIEVPDKTAIEQKLADFSQAQRVLQQVGNVARLEGEITEAEARAADLDRLVEVARQKPKDLLAQTQFPVDGVEFTGDDILVNGLSIDSLSDGEKLQMGVAIAKASTGPLGFICVDGAEKLDDDNLQWLMEQADDAHQFFIGKVLGSGGLRVTEVLS